MPRQQPSHREPEQRAEAPTLNLEGAPPHACPHVAHSSTRCTPPPPACRHQLERVSLGLQMLKVKVEEQSARADAAEARAAMSTQLAGRLEQHLAQLRRAAAAGAPLDALVQLATSEGATTSIAGAAHARPSSPPSGLAFRRAREGPRAAVTRWRRCRVHVSRVRRRRGTAGAAAGAGAAAADARAGVAGAVA